MQRQVLDENGNPIESDVVPPGGRVSVEMMLMDGLNSDALRRAFADADKPFIHDGMGNPAGFRAGYAFCEHFDDIRAKGRLDYVKQLSDAYRNPSAPREESSRVNKGRQQLTDAEAAWNEMNVRLANAWRRK
jgi:hypothetical protein